MNDELADRAEETLRAVLEYLREKAEKHKIPAPTVWMFYDHENGEYVKVDGVDKKAIARFVELHNKEAICPRNEGLESDSVPEKYDTKPATPQSPPSRTQGT